MKKNNMKREALGPCGFNMQRYSHKLQDIQSDSTTPRWGVKKHSGAGERVVIPRSWGLKSLPGLDIVMPSQAVDGFEMLIVVYNYVAGKCNCLAQQ